MGRIIRIFMYAATIILIFFVFAGIFKACSNTSQQLQDGVENVVDTAGENLEEGMEDIMEIIEDDDTEEDLDQESLEESEELFPETEYDESNNDYVEETYEEEPESNTRNQYSSNSSSNYSNSGSGKYMIVAGNYLVKDNAINMVQRLNRMGYNSAEYVVFDQSNYYTVVASRYDSRSSAQNNANSLKNNGIDCYVHNKQY